MERFGITPVDIGGFLIETVFSDDNRGCFSKLFEEEAFSREGIVFHSSESFVSCSGQNVLRGMHFQTRYPQAKLVSVISGKVYDVIVDLRKESCTYGQWRGFYLSAENHRSLLVPRGFAHGFLSLTNNSEILYQCDGKYDKESDTGIVFNDKEINIEWPVSDANIITGKRDQGLMTFAEFDRMHRFVYENTALSSVLCRGG